MTGSLATPRTTPDPLRAHGAWVYLFASVGAGALVGARHGVEPALLVGTGFTGAFLFTAAIAVGVSRRQRELVVGGTTALLAPPVALWLGASPGFLVVAACALAPAIGAVQFASKLGFLSRAALVTGIAALTSAAPACAIAGGADSGRATLLFLLLWPFYSWRSLRLAGPLEAGGAWNSTELKARGLREAAIAALWTLGVAMVLRIA